MASRNYNANSMKKSYNFLNNIILIPLFSTIIFLIFSLFAYTYSNLEEGKKIVQDYENKLIQDKKNNLKDRVNFVIECIEDKQKIIQKEISKGHFSKKEIEKLKNNAQRDIIRTINELLPKSGDYIFIYKILNFNGGDKFAVMIANPNRKDLLGKYISSHYKDAKGFKFREAFLKKIKINQEAFVKYYYKKPHSKKISPKISYFKLIKGWNWVVASGEYLDDVYKNTEQKKREIVFNIKKNNLFLVYIACFILLVSLLLSFILYRLVKRRFERYTDYIIRQKRALTSSNRALKKQLYIDNLTNLKNRRLLLKNLESRDFYAFVIIDIDDFKVINELYGNKLGNKVLIQLANILKNTVKEVRENSAVYRLGSDEFALIIKRKMVFERFLMLIERLYGSILNYRFELFENIYININVTMGITFSKKDTLSKADMALNYARKSDNKFSIYSPSIDNRLDIDRNIRIKKELLDAVKNDKIEPFFQPICDSEKRVVKYEALMRIVDQDRILLPEDFLPIAKRLKLFPKLSTTMFRKTFERFKCEDMLFSVNISLNDMINIETVKYIERLLSENKECAKRLIFEILESEGIEDFDVTKQFIQKVRNLGAKIAIDDFGSGYSSFRYILEIRPEYIKIDGSLISEIVTNKESYIMVKNIIAMAKDLNVTTVAEFVSSEEIFDVLKELGVDEFQGYYIGKPHKELLGCQFKAL